MLFRSLRREIITQLICHFGLDVAAIEHRFNIDFNSYFSSEIVEIQQMERDGLLRSRGKRIDVLPAGHLLIRNVCMVFDRYLRDATEKRYSKVI